MLYVRKVTMVICDDSKEEIGFQYRIKVPGGLSERIDSAIRRLYALTKMLLVRPQIQNIPNVCGWSYP